MEIRRLKLESKLIPISEELRKKGYEIDEYKGLADLSLDGVRITKQGFDNSKDNMLESKWLCGVILYAEGNLVLNLREGTPYSKELFNIIKHHMEY